MIIVLSILPDKIVFPSGLNTTARIGKICFTNFFIIYPDCVLYKVIMLTPPPDIKVLPSGLKLIQ